MAHIARADKLSRRSWLLAGLGIGVSAPIFCATRVIEMSMHLDGDVLYVSAPDLHFVTGKPLERLMNGLTVTYVAQLSLSLDDNRTILRRQPQRFIFSYDIWTEKFKVTTGSSSKTGLTADRAEAWCLEKLALSTSGIPHDKPVWLRLDVRVVDPKDPADLVSESGLSLSSLVKIFSRPARSEQPHWILDQPPFRLEDLKRSGRG